MSRNKCCVPLCHNTISDNELFELNYLWSQPLLHSIKKIVLKEPQESHSGVILHSFPNPVKDSERFRLWVLKIGGEIVGLDDNTIFKNRRVCHKHFAEHFLYLSNRLSKTAVPQFQLPAPHRLQTIINQDDTIHLPVEVQTTPALSVAPVPSTSQTSLPQNEGSKAAIEGVIAVDRALDVLFGDGKSIRFEDCWLRDHCRCSSCYHSDTFQRAQHILDIPDTTIVSFQNDKTTIEVAWSDDHKSTFSADFLAKFDYKIWKDSRRLKPVLWHGDLNSRITKVTVDEFLNSEEGAKRVFQSLLDYGVALVTGVGISLEATEVVCKALGGVQHTIFGGMWQFTTRADHADTAYTNLPLAAHNDNTYFTEAAGLQILHCLEHKNGTGGETILVDGFFGALELKKEYAEDFKFLTKFNLEAEYLEDGHHHTYSAPVIRVDNETQDPVQIRFNVYDRAAMAFKDSEECRSYYRSLRRLAKYYQNPRFQWRFKLEPGTVMIMDNFRVLHGRTGFSGSRVLCGSYVARSDWLDKCRVLGLIQ